MTLLTLLKNHRGPVTYVTDSLSFATSMPALNAAPTLLTFDKPRPVLK